MSKCLLSALNSLGDSNAEKRQDPSVVRDYCTSCYCDIFETTKPADFIHAILTGNPKNLSTVYIGNKGMGKTFLFQSIDQVILNEYGGKLYYCPIKLWNDTDSMNYEKNIVYSIRDCIKTELQGPNLADSLNSENFWTQIQNSLKSRDKKLIVLIDGLDAYVIKKRDHITYGEEHSFRSEFRELYEFARVGNEKLFANSCGGIIIFNRSEIHKYVYRTDKEAYDLGDSWFSKETHEPTEWIPRLVENYSRYAIKSVSDIHDIPSPACNGCALNGNTLSRNKIAKGVADYLEGKLFEFSISRPRICVDLLQHIRQCYCIERNLETAISNYIHELKLQDVYLVDELEVISALLGIKGLHSDIIEWIKKQARESEIITNCKEKICESLRINNDIANQVITFLQMANILFSKDASNDSFAISDFVKHIYEV